MAKPYIVMWFSNTGWHTQRFATLEQAERCAVKHGVKVITENVKEQTTWARCLRVQSATE